MDITMHPSRTAPLCVDCKHHMPGAFRPVCNHPSMPINLVTGLADVAARDARASIAERGRTQLGRPHCGPEGALFDKAVGDLTEPSIQHGTDVSRHVAQPDGEGRCGACTHKVPEQLRVRGREPFTETFVDVRDACLKPSVDGS